MLRVLAGHFKTCTVEVYHSEKNTDQNRSSFGKGDASATSTAQVLKRLARTRSIYFEDQPGRPSTFACCTSFPVPYLDSKAAGQKKMRHKLAENCVCVFVLSKNCVREGMRWAKGKWQVSGSNPLAGVVCSIHKAVLCAIGR